MIPVKLSNLFLVYDVIIESFLTVSCKLNNEQQFYNSNARISLSETCVITDLNLVTEQAENSK